MSTEISRFFGAFIRGSQSPGDALYEKMDGEHVHRLLELSEKSDEREYELKKQEGERDGMAQWQMTIVAIGGILGVFALCWLFLAYGKSEQVEKIIALVIGLIGGFGIGRWSSSKPKKE